MAKYEAKSGTIDPNTNSGKQKKLALRFGLQAGILRVGLILKNDIDWCYKCCITQS